MRWSRLLRYLLGIVSILAVSKDADAHYRPSTGRWIERDAQGYYDGENLYETCRSVPTRYSDPSGLATKGLGACAGINNMYRDDNGQAVNFNYIKVWAEDHGYFCDSDLCSASSLGSNPFLYGLGDRWAILGSKRKLDAEAAALASNVRPLCSEGRQASIRVLMVAPKTNSRPCDIFDEPNNAQTKDGDYLHGHGCCDIKIDIVWADNDKVVNQAPFRPDNRRFWEQFGRVHAIHVKGVCWFNPFDFSGHELRNIEDPSKARNVDCGSPFQLWPVWDEIATDTTIDYGFICHSQGCNILLSQLARACKECN